MKSVFPLFSAAFAVLVLAGCAASQQAVVDRQHAVIDSLHVVNDRMGRELLVLQDSLQFYDDIESGYYYREKNDLLDRIEKLEYDLGVCRDGGRTVATLLADELFEPASATLTPRGAEQLAGLAAQLRDGYEGRAVRIEGHTDSVPVGGRLKEQYPTNWELSAARATAVARHLIETHELPAERVEAAAYGATRPVARNDTAEGRRQNRRVRVAVVMQ